MKRQVLFLLMIASMIAGTLQAQSVTFRVNYDASTPSWYDRYGSDYYYSENSIRKDKVELEYFRKEMDFFRLIANREQIREVRRQKGHILELMREEVKDSRRKVRQAEQELRREGNYGLRKKGGGVQEYGKRESRGRGKGRSYEDDLRDLEKRQRLVREQVAILFKLENSHLDRSYRYRSQVREHIRLMHEFERTLERDLHLSRAEYKEDLYGR